MRVSPAVAASGHRFGQRAAAGMSGHQFCAWLRGEHWANHLCQLFACDGRQRIRPAQASVRGAQRSSAGATLPRESTVGDAGEHHLPAGAGSQWAESKAERFAVRACRRSLLSQLWYELSAEHNGEHKQHNRPEQSPNPAC